MPVSAWSSTLRQPGTFAPPPPPALPDVPAIAAAPAVPALPTWDRTDIPRPHAAEESQTISELGALPERWKYRRLDLGANLGRSLQGIGGYKLIQRDDGSFTWTYDPYAQTGQIQKSAVRTEQNQAGARGQFYSSYTDQAIGDALTRIGTYATDQLRQYASQIRESYNEQEAERSSLTGKLMGFITDDAQYSIEHPMKAGPEEFVHPGGFDARRFTPGARIWAGANKPNETTLKKMYPGMDFDIHQTVDGGWEVTAGPSYKTMHPRITGTWAKPPKFPNAVTVKTGGGKYTAVPVAEGAKEVGGWAAKPKHPDPAFVYYQRNGKWYAKKRLY
jgi:hypothetical protein